MTFYIKGLLISLGSVALFYAALRFFLLGTRVGNLLLTPVYLLFFLFHKNAPVGSVAGGNPSPLAYLWFWLWAGGIFAGTFLTYGLTAQGHGKTDGRNRKARGFCPSSGRLTLRDNVRFAGFY
jgi:hypothetical protein